MNILVVGGDSIEMIRKRSAGGGGQVDHWSGRKARDLARSIPKSTDAVVVILDRISHGMMRKIRAEATRRRLPVYFKKRGRHHTAVLWKDTGTGHESIGE